MDAPRAAQGENESKKWKGQGKIKEHEAIDRAVESCENNGNDEVEGNNQGNTPHVSLSNDPCSPSIKSSCSF